MPTPSDVPQVSVVIPTLGRHGTLARVLERLERQTAREGFEVLVVVDEEETDLPAVEVALAERAYPVRRLVRPRPGASAARNTGWRAAAAPLVLFLDDDVLPSPTLLTEHRAWHARDPGREIGVLGLVRWADELRVTPFMRWLDRGIQFDFEGIEDEEAGWGRFYTANVSVKRELLELVGGFDEQRLPFGYEDLDIAYRMHAHGFRLLFNRRACGEHVKEMTVEDMRARLPMMATSERAFCAKHPEVPPYFEPMFRAAAGRPRAAHRLARLARIVPRGAPVIGRRVWASADARFKEELAPDFLRAWEAAGPC
ncbi:MAG: glycosyltransferase [Thermoleophilaceae bacterium]